MYPENTTSTANSVEPDKMACSAASDLALHSLY